LIYAIFGRASKGTMEEKNERRWYVIHTYSGYENKVKSSLEHRAETMDLKDHIFQVVVPTEEEVEIKDSRKVSTIRKVFPGYVLVEMILTDKSWYVVRNTSGVTGFVGTDNKQPVPLTDSEVKSILKQMKSETPKLKLAFAPGQSVKIKEGPFADFLGVVDELNVEKQKVKVLVSFFGRETPVELDFSQVEKLT
jgi:transcriptional antiterminator NusG